LVDEISNGYKFSFYVHWQFRLVGIIILAKTKQRGSVQQCDMIHPRRLNDNHNNYNRRQSSWIDIVVLTLAWLACGVRGDLLLSRWWAHNPLGKKIRESSRRRLHPTSAVTNSLRTHHTSSANSSSKSEGLVGDKRIVRDMARNLALLQLSHSQANNMMMMVLNTLC
jgi:hypothetical protein